MLGLDGLARLTEAREVRLLAAMRRLMVRRLVLGGLMGRLLALVARLMATRLVVRRLVVR